jgi:hypothetical protein
MRLLLTALVLIAAPVAARAQAVETIRAEEPLVADAQTFMAWYAHDLRKGNREGIIARYDRRGDYIPTDEKGYHSFEEVGAIYRGKEWSAPASFEWKGLVYEPMGADAIMVTGHFVWGLPVGKSLTFAYTGVLVRQEGQLRIRLEHESPITS